jgi:predicted ATP-grasp superfamily ATP-dependent carboligase
MSDALHLLVEPRLDGATLVLAFEGWNDAGEAASQAVRYVRDGVQSVPLAEIDGEEFFDFTVQRPTVRLDSARVRTVEWPRTVFHYDATDPAHAVVVGVGPEPHLRWRAYCARVAELVARLQIGRVVLLGAYVADVVYSRPVRVTGFSSDPALLDDLGVGRTGYEGPTGIVGALAEHLLRDGTPLISLWAALPHYISATSNPRGAFALVQKLVACLEVKIDVEPLRTRAAEFEQQISALVASDPELGEYVRQLKRREFAQ